MRRRHASRITSLRGEHGTDMLGRTLLERVRGTGHAIWLRTSSRGCNAWAHNPEDSILDTRVREGWILSSDVETRTHQTVEQGGASGTSSPARGGEKREGERQATSRLLRQTPRSTTTSNSTPLVETSRPAAPEQAKPPEPDSQPVLSRSSTRAQDLHASSTILSQTTFSHYRSD